MASSWPAALEQYRAWCPEHLRSVCAGFSDSATSRSSESTADEVFPAYLERLAVALADRTQQLDDGSIVWRKRRRTVSGGDENENGVGSTISSTDGDFETNGSRFPRGFAEDPTGGVAGRREGRFLRPPPVCYEPPLATHGIPRALRGHLLRELGRLEWPRKNHRRKKVESRNYSVIWRNPGPRPQFQKLFVFLEQLMAFADPCAHWTHVAVTRNFRNSPHRDHQDVTWQFVSSLWDEDDPEHVDEAVGDKHKGPRPAQDLLPGPVSNTTVELCPSGPPTSNSNSGRHEIQIPEAAAQPGWLCIEEEGADKQSRRLHAVNTRDRIAKVDGRYMHFVKDYCTSGSANRYSLVFYSLDESARTPMRGPIDFNFVPKELSTM